jgi:hypothetical protein
VKTSFWDRPFVFPVFLLLICILTYGVIAPSLGFHWDDWPAVWLYEVYGQEGLGEFFATNRPLLGVFYSITMGLFGANPLIWHLFALLTRFGVGLATWWVLGILWPNRQTETKWISAFTVVFPGFTQQSIAVIYSHIMLALIYYLLSIGLMLRSLDDDQRFSCLLGLSLFFSALNLLSTEYFFGLELLRPVFIWLYLSGKGEKRRKFKGILKRWWPYALLVAAYLAWRIPFQARFAQADARLLNAILTDPRSNLVKLFQEFVHAPLAAVVEAWTYPFQSLQLDTSNQWGAIQVFLIAVCGILALVYFLGLHSSQNKAPIGKEGGYTGVLWVSVPALLLAGLPFVIADLPVKVTFPHDRFMLAFILGSCTFLVFLSSVVFKPIARQVFLALLLAVSAGYQIQVGLTFKQEWEDVSSFLWQLYLRIPKLEPSTTLVADETLFPYTNDYSLTAALNWMYDEEPGSGDLDYFMAYVPHRLGSVIPELSPNQPIHKKYSLYEFNGSTSNILAVVYEPPGCLRILDPRYDSYDLRLSADLYDAMRLSDPVGLIQPEHAMQPKLLTELFTIPRMESWCDYYQKADLARQQEDWEEVVSLGNFRLDDGLYSPTEFLPFIEGYARLGDIQKAFELTQTAYYADPSMQYTLCNLWWWVGVEDEEVYKQVNEMLGCW